MNINRIHDHINLIHRLFFFFFFRKAFHKFVMGKKIKIHACFFFFSFDSQRHGVYIVIILRKNVLRKLLCTVSRLLCLLNSDL